MPPAAGKGMNLGLSRFWIVADKAHDLAAGVAAGLAGGTLVSAHARERQQAWRLASARFLVEMAANPADALAKLTESGRLVQRADS
jgi:histidinol phosphatase-like enzyme